MTQPNTAPVAPPSTPSIKDRVQGVIEWMRPIIQSDGGDLELVDVSAAGIVSVRFHGACVGCPSSTATLRQGIERNIKEKVPEVTQVIPVAD